MKKMKGVCLYISSFFILMICKINQVHAKSVDCNGIFGDPRDPNSIANLIKEILWLFRIIAPILVILLGSIDLFKAVIASREDEMKKAQTTLMKRVILGVCLFFIPSIINFVLDIASRALGYDACMFNW